jgi:hypothetical protein
MLPPSPQRDPTPFQTLPGSCYGINWTGESLSNGLLGPGRRTWPTVRVVQTETPDMSVPETGEDEVVVRLISGGYILLRRRLDQATYSVPVALDGEELIHPYLAPAAATFSGWYGREAYHAGAFTFDGSAFALVGDREAGKSTTLAWLAGNGSDVLCDDLLVLDGQSVLPGPRCIDLRKASAQRLGVGQPLPSVREGGRWRIRLPPSRSAPLRGWIFLAWGEDIEVRPLSPTERLDLILRLGRPAKATAPLSFAELPALQLVRPKVWESLPLALGRLFEVLAG